MSSSKVPGYEIGKEYRSVTGISLLAMMLFSVAGFLVVINVAFILSPNVSADSNKLMGAFVFAAAMSAGGTWLNIVHNRLPHAKYTVINIYKDEDELFNADLRYSDGTVKTRNLGLGGGFWEQFGRLWKATFSGN